MRYFEIFSRFSRFAAASAVHILLQFSTHSQRGKTHVCVGLSRLCVYMYKFFLL